MIKGIENPLPSITGFVMTTVKDQAEVVIRSPVPVGDKNNTIVAGWNYGLGKSLAITTDAGQKWATRWKDWENGDKLYSQMIQWALRPAGDKRNFNVVTEIKDGRGRVIVTALDEQDRFINELNLSGSLIAPNLESSSLRMKQTAPGRYVGTFDASQAGGYMIALPTGEGKPPILTGTNVGYSAEFLEHQANLPLLKKIANLTPKTGKPGKIIDTTRMESLDTSDKALNQKVQELLVTDIYRHDQKKAASRQDIWHNVLLICGCVFFADVLVRRVAINFNWLAPLTASVSDFILRREKEKPVSAHLAQLQSKKQEVKQSLENRQNTLGMDESEPVADTQMIEEIPTAQLTEKLAQLKNKKPTSESNDSDLATDDAAEEEGYTSRLLKAKNKIWKDKN